MVGWEKEENRVQNSLDNKARKNSNALRKKHKKWERCEICE